MNNLMRYLSTGALVWALVLVLPVHAAPSNKKQTSSQNKAKPSAATKSSKIVPKKSAASSGLSCKTQKLKGGVTRKICKGVSAEPLLSSPIQDNALNTKALADKTPEVKVRSAPDRAYAVDGESFFFQGRRYRVVGLEGAGSSDMAKQSLQKSLEGGSLAIDAMDTDATGVSNAVVRINGRNLADLLR